MSLALGVSASFDTPVYRTYFQSSFGAIWEYVSFH